MSFIFCLFVFTFFFLKMLFILCNNFIAFKNKWLKKIKNSIYIFFTFSVLVYSLLNIDIHNSCKHKLSAILNMFLVLRDPETRMLENRCIALDVSTEVCALNWAAFPVHSLGKWLFARFFFFYFVKLFCKVYNSFLLIFPWSHLTAI